MADRDWIPWALGAALVVAAVLSWLWWTAAPENPLPAVYGVM